MQEAALGNYSTDPDSFDNLMHYEFLALDQDNCRFLYLICHGIGARERR